MVAEIKYVLVKLVVIFFAFYKVLLCGTCSKPSLHVYEVVSPAVLQKSIFLRVRNR